jgi:hypothetical protein
MITLITCNQTIDNAKTIEISEGDKKLILQELSAIFSIDEKSLFQVKRYILNQVGISIKFYRSRPDFCLLSNEAKTYKIDIEDSVQSTS